MSGLVTKKVDQKQVNAGNDVVAGDKNSVVNNTVQYVSRQQTAIEQLVQRLQLEVDKNSKIGDIVEDLKYFYEKVSVDGVDGLEEKLKRAGRSTEVLSALAKKELFLKLLEKWSMYESAQKIFAYLLAKIDYCYENRIFYKIDELSDAEFRDLFEKEVLQPTLDECVSGLITINHASAMGMFYWLAEQCFVRWHK